MITALQAAELAAEIYDTQASAWENLWDVDGVVVGRRMIGGEQVLAFRGSATAEDWVRDFIALPTVDLEVGMVHVGFVIGMDEVLAQIIPTLPAGAVINITGHSLGGARARIAGAKLLSRGFNVRHVCVFGSPKPGMGRLAAVFSNHPVVHQSFRHGNDPVPDMPPGAMWRHTEQWQALADINPAHPAGEVVDNLLDHRVANYVKGIAALA